MKFFTTILAALASALVVSAQNTTTGNFIFITSPTAATIFTAGKTSKITWKFTAGTGAPTNVNIDLLINSQLAASIAPNIPCTAQTYTWAIPANLTSSLLYSIRLVDASNTALTGYASYSHPFEIDGVGGKPTDSLVSGSLSASALPSSSMATSLPSGSAASNRSDASASGNATSLNATASSNPTKAASGAAVNSGGNCLVALGIFAVALAML